MSVQGSEPQRQSRFSKTERVAALGLAMIWVIASATVIVLGLFRRRWSVLIIGMVGVWYGIVWLRAAKIGRRLNWKEIFPPWKP